MAEQASTGDLYVSPQGNDLWSGRLAEPNAAGTDGPLASITAARDAVRRLKDSAQLAGPLTVWLREGVYPVRECIVFGPEDSGPVTYASYGCERPILDAGRKIESWRVENRGGLTVWVADLPEVAAGRMYFRQLFADGQRCRRARLPKEGFFQIESLPQCANPIRMYAGLLNNTFVSKPGDLRNWPNLADVEVVVLHYWSEDRLPIESFDPATRTVRFTRFPTHPLIDETRHCPARYYVDNVIDGLSEPGDWYLDRAAGRLYYVPQKGQDPAATAMVAAGAPQILKLAGQPEQGRYVEYLRFEGLTFRNADWEQPDCPPRIFGPAQISGKPEQNLCGGSQAANNIPGAIQLRGARHCAIEACRVEHVGWYGIELADGCLANRIVGNALIDLGAGGVKLNGADATGPANLRTGNNRVTDNRIYAGGRVFHAACGILSMHSFGNDLSHNDIADLYYSGISCGWVWGYADSVSKDNRIEKNHIHDIGHGLLSDLGGIYMLGVQPGTVIRGNLIHDLRKYNYGAWCIYFDEGCSHVVCENNLCYNTNSEVFHQHFGRENTVRNNIFAFGDEGIAALSKAESHLAFTFERNILLSRGQAMFLGGYACRLEARAFIGDLNVLWEITGAVPFSGNSHRGPDAVSRVAEPIPMGAWQEIGYDTHSVVANPGFADLAHFDFTLASDSPAKAVGFKPFDNSDAGPRPKKIDPSL